jgi:hypothetical protein
VDQLTRSQSRRHVASFLTQLSIIYPDSHFGGYAIDWLGVQGAWRSRDWLRRCLVDTRLSATGGHDQLLTASNSAKMRATLSILTISCWTRNSFSSRVATRKCLLVESADSAPYKNRVTYVCGSLKFHLEWCQSRQRCHRSGQMMFEGVRLGGGCGGQKIESTHKNAISDWRFNFLCLAVV